MPPSFFMEGNMYGQNYMNTFNQQANLDRINNQIAELEKMKSNMQQPIPPTNLTQNFQIAPTNREVIRYANSIDEVQRDLVVGDTPYFSKDMSVVWLKNTKGDIKTYELKEIVQKDEKDIKIDFLQAQVEELKGMINNARTNDANVDEPIESKKSTSVSNGRTSKAKSSESTRNVQTDNE